MKNTTIQNRSKKIAENILRVFLIDYDEIIGYKYREGFHFIDIKYKRELKELVLPTPL